MSDSTEKPDPGDANFEQALVRLEQIVECLEDGDAGLEVALEQYERGVRLLQQCYGLLQRAERRIELLSKVDSRGNPVTTPFDDKATAIHEGPKSAKSSSRGPRRTRGSVQPPPAPPVDSGMDESPGLF